ncbi:glycosyltransferase [bacterium]|nr:glycosyltransferase [bacterium]
MTKSTLVVVAGNSSLELSDQLVQSISGSNTPKNIPSELVRDLLLDRHIYRGKQEDLASMSDEELLIHWLAYGHRESVRKFSPNVYCLGKSVNAKEGSVVYLSSAPELCNGTYLYRTKYASMRDSRESYFYTTQSPINELIYAIFMAKEIVFSRPDNDDSLASYLIVLAKVLGVKITLDFDDLVLPGSFRDCGLGRSTFSSEINRTGEMSLCLQSSFISYADQICCSTEQIQNKFQYLSLPSIVQYNKLPKSYASDYECVKQRIYGINDRKINILYMSGTATHAKDFEICNGPLVKLAQNHADKFNLVLLGEVQLAIGSMIEYLGASVNYVGRLSYEDMHHFIAQQDVCLVPLENTSFNHSKSNIKFLESGIHGVPVIASPVDQFKRAISHTINGWLCDDPSEWYNQLVSLVESKDQLVSVSLMAYRTSVESYTF